MERVVLLLAALLLLAYVSDSPAAASSHRVLSQKRTAEERQQRKQERRESTQQQEPVMLPWGKSSAELFVAAEYNIAANSFTKAKANAPFKYCIAPAGSTQCGYNTGWCQGMFTSYGSVVGSDVCSPYPQYGYPACGMRLRGKGNTNVNSLNAIKLGGFTATIDMISSDMRSCVLRRRSSSRRLSQVPAPDVKPEDNIIIKRLEEPMLYTMTGEPGPEVGDSGPIAMESQLPPEVLAIMNNLADDAFDPNVVAVPLLTARPDDPQPNWRGSTSSQVLYDGGECELQMRFITPGLPERNLPGMQLDCLCFKGTTYVTMGAKAQRAFTAGKTAWNRWKCKDVVPVECPTFACMI